MGRPSNYSVELAESICADIASSEMSLKQVCESKDNYPGYSTAFSWLARNAEFQELYARAKELQAEVIADGMLQIADTTQEGEKRRVTQGAVKISEDGATMESDDEVEIMTADMIEHRKLRIETRKWLLGKLKPKRYGDKIQQEVTGEGGKPFTVVVSSVLDRDK